MVRLTDGRQGWSASWRNGANYNFFGGIAQAFCAGKRLEFPPAGGLNFCFFLFKQKEKEKVNKN
jgi:hypothetical protein